MSSIPSRISATHELWTNDQGGYIARREHEARKPWEFDTSGGPSSGLRATYSLGPILFSLLDSGLNTSSLVDARSGWKLMPWCGIQNGS